MIRRTIVCSDCLSEAVIPPRMVVAVGAADLGLGGKPALLFLLDRLSEIASGPDL